MGRANGSREARPMINSAKPITRNPSHRRVGFRKSSTQPTISATRAALPEQQKANARHERHGAQRDRDKRLLYAFFQIAFHGAGNACRLILFMGRLEKKPRFAKKFREGCHPEPSGEPGSCDVTYLCRRCCPQKERKPMRQSLTILIVVCAMFAGPSASARDHGRHYGWSRGHHYGWYHGRGHHYGSQRGRHRGWSY